MGTRTTLAGWKAIARHFGHDARTAQRWARDRGMPVRHVPGARGGRVYAYADELDRWLAGPRDTAGWPAPSDATPAPAFPVAGAPTPATAFAGAWPSMPRVTAPGDDALPRPGLLVLPFDYVAADPALRFVADALTDDLIGRLATAGLDQARVLSATTGRAYRAAPAAAPVIAAELGVRYLVEGSVREAGRRWRIDIRIVDALRDAVVVGDRFACTGREILLLQAQVAEAVHRQLALQLAGDPVDCEWTREVDPAAFLCHLDGIERARQWTKAGWRDALACFDQSLRIDRSYAPARAAAGCAAMNLLIHAPDEAASLEGLARAQRAQLGSAWRLTSAGVALAAKLALHDWNWDRMESALERRIRDVPSAVEPRGLANIAYVTQRRFDEAASVLAPVPTLERSADVAAWQGRTLIWSRRHAEAAACFDAARRLRPGHAYANFMRFMAAVYAQDVPSARALRRDYPRELLPPYAPFFDAMIAVLEDHPADARRHRRALVARARRRRSWWYHAARVSAALGERERALSELAASMRGREAHATLASVDPLFDGLRDQRPFRAALRAMNLPA